MEMTKSTPPVLPARTTNPPGLLILLSLAAGDALGAATEFSTPRAAEAVYPQGAPLAYAGGGPFDFAPGEATDDTQMSISTLWALREAGVWGGQGASLEVLALTHAFLGAFSAWQESGPPDIGLTTARALRSGAQSAWQVGHMNAAGNGGLMRAAALNAAGLTGERLAATSVLCGAATHLDPRSVMACSFLNRLLELLGEGAALGDAAAAAFPAIGWAAVHAPALLRESGLINAEGVQAWKKRASAAEDDVVLAVDAGLRGEMGACGGYVLETLQAALAAQHASPGGAADSREALLVCARAGNDSDTAGAVAGAIAGARGLTVPAELMTELNVGHSWTWKGRDAEYTWHRTWNAAPEFGRLLETP